MTKPEEQRAFYRRVVRDCAALVDLLNDLYPTTNLPEMHSSEREMGAWLGERRLIERLNMLRKEVADGIPNVLGG